MSIKDIAFVLFGCFQTQGMDDQQFGQSSKTYLDKMCCDERHQRGGHDLSTFVKNREVLSAKVQFVIMN